MLGSAESVTYPWAPGATQATASQGTRHGTRGDSLKPCQGGLAGFWENPVTESVVKVSHRLPRAMRGLRDLGVWHLGTQSVVALVALGNGWTQGFPGAFPSGDPRLDPAKAPAQNAYLHLLGQNT